MELREYMSIRRAYNLVRQNVEASNRLTFAEFAILCRLHLSGGTLKTSEIADYQGSLRPTMTHRTKHLARLSLIDRVKGEVDKRNIVCKLTPEGTSYLLDLCELTCDAITSGRALSRISPERVCRYVDSMGAVPCMAGELVLLGLYSLKDESCSVTDLVEELGLLQPTVSMSVASLTEDGLVERYTIDSPTMRSGRVRLSEEGRAIAEDLAEQISQIVVRRKVRSR